MGDKAEASRIQGTWNKVLSIKYKLFLVKKHAKWPSNLHLCPLSFKQQHVQVLSIELTSMCLLLSGHVFCYNLARSIVRSKEEAPTQVATRGSDNESECLLREREQDFYYCRLLLTTSWSWLLYSCDFSPVCLFISSGGC